MTSKEFIVVENAGYERECDVAHCTTFRAALQRQEELYEPDEIESLHVEIAIEIDGVRSYEI